MGWRRWWSDGFLGAASPTRVRAGELTEAMIEAAMAKADARVCSERPLLCLPASGGGGARDLHGEGAL